jgi:hypothetical protein
MANQSLHVKNVQNDNEAFITTQLIPQSIFEPSVPFATKECHHGVESCRIKDIPPRVYGLFDLNLLFEQISRGIHKGGRVRSG